MMYNGAFFRNGMVAEIDFSRVSVATDKKKKRRKKKKEEEE